jgi:hypothetical protein
MCVCVRVCVCVCVRVRVRVRVRVCVCVSPWCVVCVGRPPYCASPQSQGGPLRHAYFRPTAASVATSAGSGSLDAAGLNGSMPEASSDSSSSSSAGNAGSRTQPALECSTRQALVLASADRGVQQWVGKPLGAGSSVSLQGGAITELLPAVPGSRVKAFDVSPNGQLALVQLWDSSFAVWNLATGALFGVRPCVSRILKHTQHEIVFHFKKTGTSKSSSHKYQHHSLKRI